METYRDKFGEIMEILCKGCSHNEECSDDPQYRCAVAEAVRNHLIGEEKNETEVLQS